MAIVNASAVLSTTWSEFSTVDFACSTLATTSDCIDEVTSKLKRGTLSSTTTPALADVARWISRAKQELAEARAFTWKRRFVTATLTAGTFRYALPFDYAGGDISLRDITNDRKISIVNSSSFDKHFPDMSEFSNAQVLVATIKNRELWVGPPPDGSDVVELEYERTGDDVASSDMSWLPEIERFRCCDFATAESFSAMHQWTEAQFYYGRWERGLQKASRADGHKRWSNIGFRARSVFDG